MEITRSSIEGATTEGVAEWFTGDVYIDSVAAPAAPSRVLASLVHFMPGARTACTVTPLDKASSSPRVSGWSSAAATRSR